MKPDAFAVLPWVDDPPWRRVPYSGPLMEFARRPVFDPFQVKSPPPPKLRPHIVLTAREMVSPRGRHPYRWYFYVEDDAAFRRVWKRLLVVDLAVQVLHWIAAIATGRAGP